MSDINSSMQVTMRASHHAQAQMHKMQMQAARRSANMGRRHGVTNTTRQMAVAQAASRQRMIAALRASLSAAASRALICHPHHHAQGASLFFEHNWVASDGTKHVVFQCNTIAPRSGRPIAAFLWTAKGIEPVDFMDETMTQAATRGRLFVFPATVAFAGGETYATRAADTAEAEGRPEGLWTFATAGVFRGELFVTGPGGLGAFAHEPQAAVLVTRPTTYDSKRKTWLWAGRSSQRVGGKLRVVVDLLFADGAQRQRALLVPPSTWASDVIVVPSRQTDHHGDPLGLLDTMPRPTFGVKTMDGKPWFFAQPNRKDAKGRMLFAGKAVRRGKDDVLVAAGSVNGEEVEVELPANHRDKQGVAWFIKYANTREKKTGQATVLVPLQGA